MRYEKQRLFHGIGERGQKKIEGSTVAIVGVGALGTVVAEALCRAGIKKLILIDHDVVEIPNLPRQTLFDEIDEHKPKADAAAKRLLIINSNIKIDAYAKNLNYENINLLRQADVVVDCTDNLDTRFLINEYCKKNKKPWVHGGVAGSVGFVFNIVEGPCYNCIFKDASPSATCNTEGIINSNSYMIGAIQACEAIKILLGRDYCKQLIHVDVWKNKYDLIKVKKDRSCPVCKGEYELLQGKGEDIIVKHCKTKAAYSAKPKKNLKLNFRKLKKKLKISVDTPIVLVAVVDDEEVVIHEYGEILFKTCKNEAKIKQIAGEIYAIGLK